MTIPWELLIGMFVVAAIVANIYWLRAAYFLCRTGYSVHWFFGWMNFMALTEIEQTCSDKNTRDEATNYKKKLLVWWVIAAVLFGINFITILLKTGMVTK